MNTICVNGEKFHLFLEAHRVKLSEIKKGIAVNSPEKINGYAGISLGLPDVYICEELYKKVQILPSVNDELLTLLNNIIREEYGLVSADEKEYNAEQRWLSGSYQDVKARFKISCGMAEFTGFHEYALIGLCDTI